MKTIAASDFKARCLALLDEVASTGEEVLVTKRGTPVARLVAVEAPSPLTGSVTFEVDDDQLMEPTGETWNAER